MTDTNEQSATRDDAPRRVPFSVRRTVGAFCGLCGLIVIGLSASRWIPPVYPIELFSHFQFQYVLAAGALAILAAVVRRRAAFTIACAGLAVSGMAVVPLWFGSAAASAVSGDANVLRILQANVLTENRSPERVLATIRSADPDIIALLEVDRQWIEALAPLNEVYPHRIIEPRGDNFGLALFSRLPMSDVELTVLNDVHVPTLFCAIKPAPSGGRPFHLILTHPLPPLRRDGFEQRNIQLARLAGHLASIRQPVVLIGDLNVTMWSPVYRELAASGALRNARSGFGLKATWPADFPALMRIPIDHVLVSEPIQVMNCEVGPDVGSDHRPLIVDLAFDSDPDS